MLKRVSVFALMAMLMLSNGCGSDGPEISYVEGKVTLDGQPLANASVIFIPENGRPAAAKTDATGSYALNFTDDRQGAMLGKNRVRISTKADASETEDGTPIPASPERIPMNYNSQTELEFEVVAGKTNVANFDLKSAGSIEKSDE